MSRTNYPARKRSDASPFGGTVWAGTGTADEQSFANGDYYTPLRAEDANGDPVDDYVQFTGVALRTGTIAFAIRYAMGGGEAADVRLRIDKKIGAVGDNPTTALTSGTAFTITTSNDVLEHNVTSANSANLSVAVTAGDRLTMRITRLASSGGGLDTHGSEFRVLELIAT